MLKKKIFISSVQLEFSSERHALYEYILSDALLGKFFEPFLFEYLPAVDKRADSVYLSEIKQSDIYIGIIGKDYGSEDAEGVSPTEREFDYATEQYKTRLVFLTNDSSKDRHKKENSFILKVQSVLVRKRFGTVEELKSSVYASLVYYLEEKEIIRTSPFDATASNSTTLNDIDDNKVAGFVTEARSKRGFPLSESTSMETVLSHLNLYNNQRISNAGILLFGKEPQRFFINSEVRCVSFHGTDVQKPIPSYKVFKGDVFELVNQSVDFVLSKLDYSIGTRAKNNAIPGKYEIPKEIISEAIVNAIAHRDYTSNGSVQVMLFRDRLEIWNPGSLPVGWTTDKLKKIHASIPANPLLAEPMYLKGFIERLGTGTSDIVRIANEYGLKEPDFIQDDGFKIILYRRSTDEVPTKYRSTSIEVISLLNVLNEEMSRKEMQQTLKLKHEGNFRENYLEPALKYQLIKMKYPGNPNHPKQKYLITKKGKVILNQQ